MHENEKDYARLFFLIILGVIMFFVYSFLIFAVWLPGYNDLGQVIFSWPDAMANFSFIDQFVQNNHFYIEFSDNSFISNIVHPRSVNVFNSNIVPGSFLGIMLIYGIIGKLISSFGTLFLTPLLAVIAVFFYYNLIKRVWSEYIAFISSLLLFFLAAYWYYSSMVMLHTILFIALTLIGFWFLAKEKFSYWNIIFSGIFIGLALTVRTIEILWIAPILIAILFIFGRKKCFFKALLFIIFLSITFVPTLLQNKMLYGDYFSSGYFNLDNSSTELLEKLPTEFQLNSNNKYLDTFKSVFLPFGFNYKQLLKTCYKFLGVYYGPYLVFAILATILFLLQKKKNSKQLFYLGSSIFISIWLIFYYGNWVFEDIDVLKYNFLSSSYTRYFLPIFILLLPGVGFVLEKLKKQSWSVILKNTISLIVLLTLITQSVYLVFFSQNDGLLALKRNLETYYLRYSQTSSLMEKNAILITDKTDKIFFPKYQVIVFLLDYSIFPEIQKIEDKYPIYYLSRMPNKDISYINEKKIKEYNLQFEKPIIIDKEYRLFQLNKIDNAQ